MDDGLPKDNESALIIASVAMGKAARATFENKPEDAAKWLDVVTKAYKSYGEMVHIAALIHIVNNPRK